MPTRYWYANRLMKGKGVFAGSFANADVCWLLVFVVSVQQWLAIKEI